MASRTMKVKFDDHDSFQANLVANVSCRVP